jgi:hypothetical protein
VASVARFGGNSPSGGKTTFISEFFFRSFCRKWGIFGFISISYLGNFKIPYLVNGEFIEIFWGILLNKSGNTGSGPFEKSSANMGLIEGEGAVPCKFRARHCKAG